MAALVTPTAPMIAGGNLTVLAPQPYGDAPPRSRIAAANGLWDFNITVTVKLVTGGGVESTDGDKPAGRLTRAVRREPSKRPRKQFAAKPPI